MIRRYEHAETLAKMARQIALLGFGPALEDVLTPMLAEAVAEAKRRGDAAVNENREVENA